MFYNEGLATQCHARPRAGTSCVVTSFTVGARGPCLAARELASRARGAAGIPLPMSVVAEVAGLEFFFFFSLSWKCS